MGSPPPQELRACDPVTLSSLDKHVHVAAARALACVHVLGLACVWGGVERGARAWWMACDAHSKIWYGNEPRKSIVNQ